MPQETGGMIISDETKTKTPGTRSLGGRPEEDVFIVRFVVDLPWGRSRHALEYLVHGIASKRSQIV